MTKRRQIGEGEETERRQREESGAAQLMYKHTWWSYTTNVGAHHVEYDN